MSEDEPTPDIKDPVIIRQPVAAWWCMWTVDSRETGNNEWVVRVQVEINKGINGNMSLTCSTEVKDRITRVGYDSYPFILTAIVTDDGPAVKADKVEIDNVWYKLYER